MQHDATTYDNLPLLCTLIFRNSEQRIENVIGSVKQLKLSKGLRTG